MSDRIRRALASRIIGGQLAPGERLVEMRIAEEFRTSQAPVREAFRELEVLRLVKSEPYRGTTVREVGEREMMEAYGVRAILEQAAGELAAPSLKGDVGRLRAILREVTAAAMANDGDAYAHHDLDFHRGIVEASGNLTLLQVWESLGFETRTPIMIARYGDQLAEFARVHDPIVDALEVGDGSTAGRLLREHSESIPRIHAARRALEG